MKSVKMSAKMFLAVAAVASISLTSCEKEDFNVDVPSIEIPNIQFPEAKDGTVYVMLSASASDGTLLNGVTFASDNEKYPATDGIITVTGEAVTLTITASKDGYLTDSKKITVTPMPNQLASLPINFVLSGVEVEDIPVVEGVTKPNEGTTESTVTLPTPEGQFQAGTYKTTVQAPTAAPFLNDNQKKALNEAIDKLTAPATRGAAEDLQVAKDMLRAKVNAFATKVPTVEKEIEFTLDKPADKVQIVMTSHTATTDITISAEVNGKTYSVNGSYTTYTSTVYTPKADGTAIGHGHGHGHGNDANAGGSEGTPQA